MRAAQLGFMPPQIDIRRWKEGEPSKGITLNDAESRKLLEALHQELTDVNTSTACPEV